MVLNQLFQIESLKWMSPQSGLRSIPVGGVIFGSLSGDCSSKSFRVNESREIVYLVSAFKWMSRQRLLG